MEPIKKLAIVTFIIILMAVSGAITVAFNRRSGGSDGHGHSHASDAGSKSHHGEAAAPTASPAMSGTHAMGGEAAMTNQSSATSKNPDAMQLEASRLQLEASRLQLEVSRMQLEKAGLEASSPSNQTIKAESNKAVQPAHQH